MKIILSLRNPIDRAFSHWNMFRTRGFESLSFADAIRSEEERLRATPVAERWRIGCYIDRGYYVEQIRRLRRYFPPQQILIIRQEQLRADHNATLGSIWQFLDLAPMDSPEPLEMLVGDYAAPINEDDRQYLREAFSRDIKSLERMLGWDCNSWLA